MHGTLRAKTCRPAEDHVRAMVLSRPGPIPATRSRPSRLPNGAVRLPVGDDGLGQPEPTLGSRASSPAGGEIHIDLLVLCQRAALPHGAVSLGLG